MPEIVMLVCDHPRCQEEGTKYLSGTSGELVETILCEKHSKPLRDIQSWGSAAEWPKPAGRGTGRDRLRELIVDEPEE